MGAVRRRAAYQWRWPADCSFGWVPQVSGMVESAMGTHEVGVSRHTWELMPATPQTRTQQSRKQTPQGLAEATTTLREQQALAQETLAWDRRTESASGRGWSTREQPSALRDPARLSNPGQPIATRNPGGKHADSLLERGSSGRLGHPIAPPPKWLIEKNQALPWYIVHR